MRALVIGTGFGRRTVAPMYRAAGVDCDIVSPHDGDAIAQGCGAGFDFISVHSPPFLHRDHVLRALDHGCAVVCDKPFGQSADDAREMARRAAEAGVIHLVNFEFRHEETRREAKRLIDDGAIGSVQHIHWTAFNASSRIPLARYGWLWDRSRGGGWIGAYGSHIIDTLRWWAGDIVAAGGVCRTDLARRPDRDGIEQDCTAEDAFSAHFVFASGATAAVDTSFASAAGRPSVIEIFGTEGVLVLKNRYELQMRRTDGEIRDFAAATRGANPIEDAYRAWAKVIRDAVASGRQVEPSFSEGLACAIVMDQLRANAVWARPPQL